MKIFIWNLPTIFQQHIWKQKVLSLPTLIKDGINADFQAMDFKKLTFKLKVGDKINIDIVKDAVMTHNSC